MQESGTSIGIKQVSMLEAKAHDFPMNNPRRLTKCDGFFRMLQICLRNILPHLRFRRRCRKLHFHKRVDSPFVPESS